jgi:hypothetical protein
VSHKEEVNLLKSIRKNWKDILTIILIVSVIILSISLNKANTYKDMTQGYADNVFKDSISTAMSGLNIDYTSIELDEHSRNYHYSKIISGLGTASNLVPFTSYKDEKSDLSYTLERLELALVRAYSSGFKLETQTDIYNYLLEISLNPTDKETLDKLNKLIDLID